MKCFSSVLRLVLITGSLFSLTAAVNADDNVRETPIAVSVERAFPNVTFERPIVVTHANDGTNRLFVAEQDGIIRVMPNDQDVEEATVFLDIDAKCKYADNQNEEGLLGFAFHPDFKANGEFFVYYTTTETDLMSVVSRFKVSAADPNVADPKSEEEIMRIPQPFWNHNGGTLCFGPDGYLYIGLGDGGSGNDPHGNGQNLTTQLGSILRIDVNRAVDGRKYAIPADNPFRGKTITNKKGETIPLCEEIFAYGVRNIWRMAFDRKTGTLWAADVGQGVWEEINIITKGGNYGWNIREGKHWFRPDGKDAPREDLIDPIWEYSHEVGKSITGGLVYRGTKVPELVGKYVYADYVTGLIWALEYDEKAGKVVANHSIPSEKQPVMSFGDDEQGEVYFTTPFGMLYRFASGAGVAK